MVHETGNIFNIGFALSRRPYFYSAYVLELFTVYSITAVVTITSAMILQPRCFNLAIFSFIYLGGPISETVTRLSM